MKLGENTKTGRTAFIKENARSTHMQVIGSTGTGKSKFLEWMIQQDILNNQGLCLLDPHGTLYDKIVNFLAQNKYFEKKLRKIVLLDLRDEKWCYGFNPLRVSSNQVSFLVDNMFKACSSVWGDEDTNKTPLLKRCLTSVLHILAEKNLSLNEAYHLIDSANPEIRLFLTHNISDRIIQNEWDNFNNKKPKEFDEDFMSTRNRLIEFLRPPLIRNVVGQTEATIDFKKLMDDGYMVLVNLSVQGGISRANSQLLGALIINDLFINALGREEGAKPFYLYIDECADYINDDISGILDQCRKFGLHLILSHQTLAQLKHKSEKVYQSVMANAKTKVVFGGLEFNEARELAQNVFIDCINFEEWKGGLTRPTLVGYDEVWFENYTKSRGSSRGSSFGSGHTDGLGWTTGSGSGSSQGYREDPSSLFGGSELVMTSTSFFESSGQSGFESDSSFSGTSESESESESHGRSQGLKPILKDLPLESYSLEEQLWRVTATLKQQLQQHAIIRLPDPRIKPIFLKVPTLKDTVRLDEAVASLKKKVCLSTYFIRTAEEAQRTIEDRQKLLAEQAKEFLNPQKEEEQANERTEEAEHEAGEAENNKGKRKTYKKSEINDDFFDI